MKKLLVTCLFIISLGVSACSSKPYTVYEQRVTSAQASAWAEVPEDATSEQMASWGNEIAADHKDSPSVVIAFHKGGRDAAHLVGQYASGTGFSDLRTGAVPSQTPAPTGTPETHTVEYKVTPYQDTTNTEKLNFLADIETTGGITQKDAPTPWSKTSFVNVGDDLTMVVNTAFNNPCTAQIIVDGSLKAERNTKADSGTSISLDYRVGPNGATAACKDGTFYFNQETQGACSDHGGIYQKY